MKIPKYVENIIEKLEKAGFEAYIVGGCVRDLLLKKEPKDWDITTNAKPEEVLKIIPDGKYENIFGTVLVPIKNKDDETEDVVEVTTYRSEQGYSNSRHPDEVKFEEKLDKDLERRDFTINAMAMSGEKIVTVKIMSTASKKNSQASSEQFNLPKNEEKKRYSLNAKTVPLFFRVVLQGSLSFLFQ